MTGHRAAQRLAVRIALEGLGWILVIAGTAALVLPGPGMLMLFGGFALLARQYAWARFVLRPVRFKAMIGAAEGVATWPRVAASALGAVALAACGALWAAQPPAPTWWTLPRSWWLIGGRGAGWTLIGSSIVAVTLLVYSWRRFRAHPDEVDEIRMLERAHWRARRTIKARRRAQRQRA